MSIESRMINVMSGRARGLQSEMLRGALSLVEPVYATAATLRNHAFDSGRRKTFDVARPVISIGNITTGGTGKTPIVAWVTNFLRNRGHQPAILLRGYKFANGSSDEAMLLEQRAAPSLVMVNADRVAGAAESLRRNPSISCFVLDDGFQHRTIARNLDLVLIDATAPFGFDHVLPRGLLREPLEGLRRADGVVITRSDRVSALDVEAIVERVRQYVPDRPVLRCSLKLDHFLDEKNLSHAVSEGVDGFAICGIGNPQNFIAELAEVAGPLRGHAVFADHHAYTAKEWANVADRAVAVQAQRILTTEKDWVKLKTLTGHSARPIWRAVQSVQWADGDEARLASMLIAAVTSLRF